MSTSGEGPSPAALSAVATIALVRSWVEWRRHRVSGADPTTIEPESVTQPALVADLARLRDGTHRLLVDGVASRLETNGSSRSLHLVALVSTAQDLVPVSHRIHQRLLSLFPAVDETLVERARLLESSLRSIVDDGPASARWMHAIRTAHALVDDLSSADR